MSEMGRINLGKVSTFVCRMFEKFLHAFRGDTVCTLEFLMQRSSPSKPLSSSEPKEDLIIEAEKDQVARVYNLIDSFLSQHKLLSRSDAVELLVLGSGVEWKQDNSLKFVSRHSTNTFNKLNQDRLKNKFCDLQIFIDSDNSDPFHAHKCMLAATSEYFAEILKPDTKTITIPCLVHPSSLSLVLEWIYTGTVMIDREHCLDMQKLAKFLGIEDLNRMCKDYFVLSNEFSEDADTENDFVILIDDEDLTQPIASDYGQGSESSSRYAHREAYNTHNGSTIKPAEPRVKQNLSKRINKRTRKKRATIHSCQICEASFQTKSHLERHMISHSGERKHCCTTCGKLFLKADHLTRHELTHSAERPFDCDQCDKKFKTKDNLKRHLQTHSDDRPFFCEICAKQFKDKAGLLIHQKSHSKSEPVCPHCGKRFKQRNRLAYHIIRHTNPLSCNICGKTFSFQNHLQRHTMTHTGDRPFSCETCGRQFVDGHGLKLHQKIHSGIGLHACPQCDRKFLDRFHLRRHMKMHSGEKPYRCGTCEKTFSRADNCESHKKSCVVKVAMQKDLQSFTQQEGETLKIKKVLISKDQTVEKTASQQQDSQHVAIAVNANELRTSNYKRIAKKPPELKLIFLKNHENNLPQLPASSTVVQSDLIHYVPPARTNAIQTSATNTRSVRTAEDCDWSRGPL